MGTCGGVWPCKTAEEGWRPEAAREQVQEIAGSSCNVTARSRTRFALPLRRVACLSLSVSLSPEADRDTLGDALLLA